MSGHSKWHSIKYKKGAADAKRGKIFTKHAKLITIATRDGGTDTDMNPSLRAAIVNAKADNVPNANIDKAIKKGAGADKDGASLVEATYEGYGPCGTALLVEAITDNKNRTVASVKIAFTKNGGNMGSSGTVAWKFEKKGVILAKTGGMDKDEAELMAIDAGAEDLSFEDGEFEILTDPTSLMKVKDSLEEAGFEIQKAEFDYRAINPIKIESVEDAKKIFKLIDAIEDDEDVSNVYGDFDISDELLEQMD